MPSEKFTVSGRDLLGKVQDLLHEGNIRRLRLIHEGKPLIDIPLSVGAPVVAATVVVAPLLAAIGAIAALVTECTIEVEKVEEPGQGPPSSSETGARPEQLE